jgi:hypothetical protein
MRFILTFCLAIVFALSNGLMGCSSNSRETSTGTIAGVVKDMDSGQLLSSVAISDGTTTVTTDNSGAFSITEPTGTSTLSASSSGYVTTYRSSDVSSGATTTLNWFLTKSPGVYWDYSDTTNTAPQIPAANMDYTILAWSEDGMNFAQDDYSYFMLRPPYVTLHVQVIQRGNGLVTDTSTTNGIAVTYSFPEKTNSAGHTNFWSYTGQYGWNVAQNVGITGTSLAGNMVLDDSGLGFVAKGIPLTPYDDDGTWDPYGTAVISVVSNLTGSVLQTANVVAPISTEMNCKNCHGTTNTDLNILQAHDSLSGTNLAAQQASGTVHACGECHADPSLGLGGTQGVENLSLAMHNFHKDKMTNSSNPVTPDCYNCHPGPQSEFLRGNMYRAGQTCSDCHGDMAAIALSLQNGRQPWLQEPKCGDCHGTKHSENPGKLFHDSVLLNSPDTADTGMGGGMSGNIYCASCHNSPHAEFRSTNTADSNIPEKFQGDNYWIWNCYVCHGNDDYMPFPSMHQ